MARLKPPDGNLSYQWLPFDSEYVYTPLWMLPACLLWSLWNARVLDESVV